MKLTQKTVDGLRPPDGKSEILCFDDGIPGFGIRVGVKRKSWIVQWQTGAKQRRMTIGHTGMMSAVKARDTAKDILARVRLGEDPQANKYAARGAVMTGDLLPAFLANKRGRGRSVKTLKEMERYLTKYASPLHGLPLATVDRATIANFLNQLSEKRSPQVADGCRRYLSSFWSWAMKNGHVEKNPVLLTERPAETVVRERLLMPDEIIAVWRATDDGSDFSRIVRLLMFTGQRRQEIAGLNWDEIDLERKLIRLPAGRVKNKSGHTVPLSTPAFAIIQSIPRREDHGNLFGAGPRPFSGFSKAKAALDKRMAHMTGAEPKDWRLHDLRKHADTMMRELGVNPWVVEAVLNHLPQGVSKHYNFAQLDQGKREALDKLADYILETVGDTSPAGIAKFSLVETR